MMYDKTNGGKTMRLFNSCGMAWWHTYKYASFKLWEFFANDVFAPLFHTLYPGHGFFIKPSSFAMITTHFLLLLKSYPAVRDDLQALTTTPGVSATSAAFGKDLQFLLGTAIPVVSL